MSETTAAASPVSDEWEGLLDKDEQVIWQGRPDASFVATPSMFGVGAFSVFFTSFALFWMIGASQAGGLFWMFGLIHFSAGLAMFVRTVFGPSFVRARTFYTLTRRRAFIAKDLPIFGRSLKSYPINANTTIEFKDGRLPSIIFATETRMGTKGQPSRDIGFERIADGRNVLQLIRDIQRSDT